MTTIPQLLDGNALGTLHLDRAARVRPSRATARADAPATTWSLLQQDLCVLVRGLDVAAAALVAVPVALLAGPAAVPWVLGLALGLPLLVALQGGSSRTAVRRGTYGRPAVLRAGVLAGLACLCLAQLLGVLPPVAATLVALPAIAGLMYAGRAAAASWVRAAGARGRVRQRTLLVGDDDALAALLADERAVTGHEVVGRCGAASAQQLPDVPVLGSDDEVDDLVRRYGIDVVMVAGTLEPGRVRALSNRLSRGGAALVVAPSVVDVAPDRVHRLPMSAGWDVRLLVEPRRRKVLGKTLTDRLLGGLILLAVLPVVALAAVAVRLTSPGPAFYGQTRVGLDGRPFTMWKLRSMVVDAEAMQAVLLEQHDGNEVLFKMRRDPRVTPVGAFLRRYSLDELPQLWNVVRGDMSLVGPRPPLPAETARYRGEEPRRLIVKPGLTGLWQVSGRSDLSWADSIRMDLRYVDNWSLALDLRILAATTRAVLGGHGAY